MQISTALPPTNAIDSPMDRRVEERFKRESANSGLIFRDWTSRLLRRIPEWFHADNRGFLVVRSL